MYALRLDVLSEDNAQQLSAWLDKVSSGHLVVREESNPNENTHYHAVLHSKIKATSLRQSFRRAFPDHKGNAAYSLKECDEDPDGYGRYICKGLSKEEGPNVVIRQGLLYTDEWVRQHHEQYWVNNDLIAQARAKRKMNAVERLESVCKEKKIRWSDRTAIATEYVRWQKEARRPINSFAARATVNTVALLLDDSGEAEEQLAIEIAGRF